MDDEAEAEYVTSSDCAVQPNECATSLSEEELQICELALEERPLQQCELTLNKHATSLVEEQSQTYELNLNEAQLECEPALSVTPLRTDQLHTCELTLNVAQVHCKLPLCEEWLNWKELHAVKIDKCDNGNDDNSICSSTLLMNCKELQCKACDSGMEIQHRTFHMEGGDEIGVNTLPGLNIDTESLVSSKDTVEKESHFILPFDSTDGDNEQFTTHTGTGDLKGSMPRSNSLAQFM